MGKKTLNVDGKQFGKKLLSQNIRITPPRTDKKAHSRKFTEALGYLREEGRVKEAWESLWKWRNLKTTSVILTFFHMQCVMRIREGWLGVSAKLDKKILGMAICKLLKDEDCDEFYYALLRDPIGMGKIAEAVSADMDKAFYKIFGQCNNG